MRRPRRLLVPALLALGAAATTAPADGVTPYSGHHVGQHRAAAGTVLLGASCALWSVRTDGTHLTRLSSGKALCHTITDVSPDGVWMLYNVTSPDPSNFTVDVYKRKVAGGTEKALTSNGTSYGGHFSPSGKRIAYSDTGSATTKPAVRTMLSDGSKKHTVASDADLPTWSPDGSSLYYEKYSGDIDRTCFMRAASLVRRKLSSGVVTTIAKGGVRKEVYPSDVDGYGVLATRWTCDTSGANDFEVLVDGTSIAHHASVAAWSSDGKWIAYRTDHYPESTDGDRLLRLMKPDGTKKHVVDLGQLSRPYPVP